MSDFIANLRWLAEQRRLADLERRYRQAERVALRELWASDDDAENEDDWEVSEMEKTKWAVVHLIHVKVPHEHIAKLFIVDVPKSVTAGEIKSALTRAGYWFGEFGIRWANHYLAEQSKWVDEVVGAYKLGEVERVTWDELVKRGTIED
jgi:hypothetical protein